MNRGLIVIILVVVGVMVSGCQSRYQITLIGNKHIITTSKPKRDVETRRVYYKDHEGKTRFVPFSRVLRVGPVDSNKQNFNSTIPQLQ